MLPSPDTLRRRRNDRFGFLHRFVRLACLPGVFGRLRGSQREQLINTQFAASRLTFMGVLAAGGGLLMLLALMEWAGLAPGIGYPVWVTAFGGPVLIAFGYAALNAAALWQRILAFVAYGIILAALVTFPLGDVGSYQLIRSELFNLFVMVGLVLATRRRTLLATVALIGITATLRLHLYGQPWSGAGIYWLVVGAYAAVGITLRQLRLDLAAQAMLLGQKLREEAMTDYLTGVLNRAGWERIAPDAHSYAGANTGGICCLFFDVDHFKRVNDIHGHSAGDRVLATLGETLRRAQPQQAVSARLGGEEFAVLLPGNIEQACAFGERIRHEFASGVADLGVTISAGVAAGTPLEPLGQLMKRADTALYAAKREGRNRIAIARPSCAEPAAAS